MQRRNFLNALGLGASAAYGQQIGDVLKLESQLEGTAHRAVMGRNGVVATADQHGSLAGIRTLMKGGNAVDAIVAAAAALNVTEPYMSGIGGFGGYMMIYMANERKVYALDMMGTSPKAARREKFTEENCDEGPLAPIVPGSLKGWCEALSRFGTMSLGDLFEPAIELAERGFVVTRYDSLALAGSVSKLAKFPESARIFLPGGKAPRMGQVIRQTDLARTFRRIALEGPDAFYEGAIGQEIIAYLKANGGLLTMEDMAGFRVRWREPITTEVQGHKLYGMPPGSCGMTMFQALNIMDGMGLRSMDPYGVDFAHAWIEAMKLALIDDDRYNTGRDVEIPVSKLISKAYADEQRAKIAARRAGAFPTRPLHTVGTTSLAAADRWGNMVAFTQSLVSGFGCGVVAGNTGVMLNNGHRYGFVLEPDHINVLQAGQRAKGVMSPALVFRGDQPVMAVGAAGGYTIPQTVGQVITKFLTYGYEIQHAIASPRMMMNRAAGRVPVGNEATTYVEQGFPAATLKGLVARGHRLSPPGNAGGVQAVAMDPESGALMGGSDPRRDGHAIAW